MPHTFVKFKDFENARTEQTSSPRPYSAPSLKVFGPVGALTQGGSNMVGEMVMMDGTPTQGMMML